MGIWCVAKIPTCLNLSLPKGSILATGRPRSNSGDCESTRQFFNITLALKKTLRQEQTYAWIWSRVNVEKYLIGVAGKHPPCWNSMCSASKWAWFIFANVFLGWARGNHWNKQSGLKSMSKITLIYLILIFLCPFSGCPQASTYCVQNGGNVQKAALKNKNVKTYTSNPSNHRSKSI